MSEDRRKTVKRRNSPYIHNNKDDISIDSAPKAILENNENKEDNDNLPGAGTLAEKWLEIKNVKRNYWKKEEELLLKEWADKAQCYEWMHFKTHEKYKSQNTWFTIPVIVISTITGTANFAQERFGPKSKEYVTMGVGAANIIAGIITTIYQYLKIAELNESHKIAYTEWGKLYRNIKTELKKHPFDRDNHTLIMKYCKKEFDRLIETSPSIPKDIVAQFNKAHRKSTITKPEICNKVDETEIYNMDDTERQQMIDELNEDTYALQEMKEQRLLSLEADLAKLNADYTLLQSEYARLKKENASFKENQAADTIIHVDENLEKFKKSFTQMNGRGPSQTEINTLYNEIYLTDNAEMIHLDDDNVSMA